MSNDIEKLRKLKGISRSALRTMNIERKQEKITKTYRVLRTTDEFLRSCYSQGLGRQGEIIDVAVALLRALADSMDDEAFKELVTKVKANPESAKELFNEIIK